MKLKNKLLLAILLLVTIPINVFAYSNYVIASGETIGIEVNSKGVLVVGFYEINNKFLAKDAGFEIGDKIVKINNKSVESISTMVSAMEDLNTNEFVFQVVRNNTTKDIKLNIEQTEDEIIKTGLYVKDQINGIGTLTYIDPETKRFGALGHEIVESTTAQKFEIKDGKIYDASVSKIEKSRDGKAGEKNATYDTTTSSGEIDANEITGIYGTYKESIENMETIEVGELEDITTGPAKIKTVINNDDIEEFDINILNIDTASKTKNILFEITDSNLLTKTGGVVQGMSGSPIIQNNKIIGAVNYVIVNDTKKGYGIFITTMLKEGDK